MRRKFLSGERIMYVDDKTSVNCVLAVKIRGTLSPENLRAALFQIQAKHVLLRAKVEQDSSGIPFFVVDDVGFSASVSNGRTGEIPLLIEKRKSDQDWFIRSKLEWECPFDKKQGPLIRVIWLKGEQVSDLILVCPHFVCDGISLVNLMRELLLFSDQPAALLPQVAASSLLSGSAAYVPSNTSLLPSLEELLPARPGSAGKRRWKAKLFSMLACLVLSFKTFRKKSDVKGRRNTGGKKGVKERAGNGDGYMIRWKLNRETTEILVNRCRSESTSVHAALCVAFLAAFREVRGDKAHGKVICPVDIRRFIPEIKTDDLFAFAPIVELSISRNRGLGFWDKARELKKKLSEKMASLNAYELLLVSEHFHSLVKKMVNFLLSDEGTHDFTLSNMGRLDLPAHYLGFAIETIYSPTVLFPWKNPNTIVISTFRGQMDFTILSNDGFLAYKDAATIRDKAMELLLKRNWQVHGTGGEERE